MSFFAFLTIPLILFFSIVAPIWIVMHYRSVNRASQSLNEEERENIDAMLSTIDKLQDRVQALESLLDAEQANWRSHNRPHSTD